MWAVSSREHAIEFQGSADQSVDACRVCVGCCRRSCASATSRRVTRARGRASSRGPRSTAATRAGARASSHRSGGPCSPPAERRASHSGHDEAPAEGLYTWLIRSSEARFGPVAAGDEDPAGGLPDADRVSRVRRLRTGVYTTPHTQHAFLLRAVRELSRLADCRGPDLLPVNTLWSGGGGVLWGVLGTGAP